MIQLYEERRPPITPELALRVAIFGGVALTLFAIIFFRLWFLQVLSGDKYLAQAMGNQLREIRVQSPRGYVVDRNGTILVDNRVGIGVQVDPQKLPPDGPQRAILFHKLASVLKIPVGRIGREIKRQRKLLPYSNVTLKTDATRAIYTYLFERRDQFPGVTARPLFVRHYPHRDLAAHLFGTVGEISPPQLKLARFRGVPQGTIVGQGGIENVYDRYLRGRDGATRVQVDALGQPKGELQVVAPHQGQQLKLSIDLDLQKAGQQALKDAGGGLPGAFVALDPRNGEVLALGSTPTFDPNLFSKPVSTRLFKQLNSKANGAPLYNRAIAGLYPTGSTYKVITATAALQSRIITPSTVIDDPGSVKIGNITFKNAGGAAHGSVALRQALQVSSDVYFYKMGAQLNGVHGEPLQTWSRRLGIGRQTGIDLPGEFKGLLPTPAWRDRLFRKHQTDRPWSTGDNVNLAVGQGDLQATPLQMAVAYSAVANGGRVVTPHVGLDVEDAVGRALQRIDPGASRKVHISDANRQAILDGLHLAASAPGGTSADVFKGFPRKVFGKTGTAQRAGQGDQSWYVCYVPDGRRPVVVAVTIERGGFGAQAAAPAARLILSQWFGIKKKFVTGQSRTR
ncbi:MAG TPA: penicillin-binding protein 2 [Solirubrobacteraceae bacterium]|nr:penicillin-binding protein 2 [Solirubrobacteraceae bacterium]